MKMRSEQPLATVVQFPHPNPEYRLAPNETVISWNTRRQHYRRFMRCAGAYLDERGRKLETNISFWGEWEAQGTVVRRFAKKGDHPRQLVEPWWTPRGSYRGHQNTDPLVFGRTFIVSNCKQQAAPFLQRLAPGSVILFGSRLHGAFVLDTVFVSASASLFVPAERLAQNEDDPLLRHLVLEPLSAHGKTRSHTFALHRGRMHADGLAPPFSFVPCTPGEEGFARPAIQIPGLINPANGRQPSGARGVAVTEVWREVVDQVQAAGLALGVEISEPRRVERS